MAGASPCSTSLRLGLRRTKAIVWRYVQTKPWTQTPDTIGGTHIVHYVQSTQGPTTGRHLMAELLGLLHAALAWAHATPHTTHSTTHHTHHTPHI